MTAPKPIQIFRAGNHTAMSGIALAFSEADLQATANAYDPAKHEAPLVIGHPSHDAPAYGWVKKLSFADALEAMPDQVDPVFAEMVAAGKFKKISASFYTPDSPSNPVPGVYYLRHVGFLGAQPPAVKGLRSPEFAAAEEGVIVFGDWGDMQNASLWRRLRDWFIGSQGLDAADKILPDYAVASLEDAARQDPDSSTPTQAYSESTTQETNKVTPEQKAALEAENARLSGLVAASEARDKLNRTAGLRAAHAAFCETLITAGKLLPAQKDFMCAFMDRVAEDSGVIEFGEGAAKKSQPGIDGLKAFLSALPKMVDFNEHATGDGTAVSVYRAPSGFEVDPERMELHTKAVAYQEKNKCDYITAVTAVGGN